MERPYYSVNGVDILPLLADGGFVWEENDVDSADSGRTLDGDMDRTRVALKDKHTLKCRPLLLSESMMILQLISLHAMSTIDTNIHPKQGKFTATMYNSSRTAGIFCLDEDGESEWENISFTFIQK